ncbi:hypothetical protein [Ideonella sp.]|uniref:hypothetical protein n=1 Tax=Ideonella sp. TaxID=1929293 RepID=UPI0035AE4DC5
MPSNCPTTSTPAPTSSTYQVNAGQDGQIVIKLKGLVAGAPALVAGFVQCLQR